MSAASGGVAGAEAGDAADRSAAADWHLAPLSRQPTTHHCPAENDSWEQALTRSSHCSVGGRRRLQWTRRPADWPTVVRGN